MKEACFSENEKVISGGVRFFLGGDQEREQMADESDDDVDIDIAKLRHQAGVNKKGKKERELKRAAATIKRKEKKRNAPHPLNFSALHRESMSHSLLVLCNTAMLTWLKNLVLHDPQGFSESLFSKHVQNSKSKLALESKILVLQLVSRLVG